MNDIASKSGNSIVPNSYQTPNVFVDRLMFYLTPSEWVVLSFATRQILGWQNRIALRSNYIAIGQFTDGLKKSDGTMQNLGCGLSVNAVRKALDGLQKYGILTVNKSESISKKGRCYHLQDDELAINWIGLRERKLSHTHKQARQLSSANATLFAKRMLSQ